MFNIDNEGNNQYCEIFLFNKDYAINNIINNTL